MSRKQELYCELLSKALPHSRNTLCQFHQPRWYRIFAPKKQRSLREAYEIAQLVHNLYVTILEEEFQAHDIWFLNVQARAFIEGNNDKTCAHYSWFAYYI